MKRLFYPPPIREFMVVIALLLLGNQLVLGEGSKDFWDYPGFRLFYLIAPTGNISNEQQTKVYASEGEFINVGASHVGIVGGFIQVYRPDGTLHSTFDGTNGQAIINNHVEELAGPTGGGTTNGQGYIPGIIQVQAGEAGVWSVVLDYPLENENATAFTNIMNGTPWTREADQPINGRVCLAWDITITQAAAGNQGGTAIEGRVYSNEYRSMVSRNGNTTSPTFYVLTRSGFLYEVNFMESDPFGFPIFSNSRGIVDGNRMATYQSWDDPLVNRSDNPESWIAGNNYLYDPQAEDSGLLWNNKVFFNPPDPNMPSQAVVTNIFGSNTHSTWLLNQVPAENEGQNAFGFSGNGDLSMIVGQGGNFIYTSQVPGLAQLRLDLNNNGSFDDPVDRTIEAESVLGPNNMIFWDGKDGQGNDIPANANFQFRYDLSIRGGEVHIMMDDVENNLGGVTFTRLNGVGSPSSDFFYDHTNVDGPVSGGGTPGNALATTTPYIYTDNAGNRRLLDFWTFVQANNFGNGSISIAVVPAGGGTGDPVTPPLADNDGDGIPDEDDIDDDNDGISDAAELAVAGNNGDTDGDGVPDIFDLDSDNDGISDLVEAGHGQADTNGDGVIDGTNFGANGLHNSLETSDALTAVINYVPADTDFDGVPDHIDLDSDNDGLLDVVEANFGNFDTNNDGRIDNAGALPTVDANGLVSIISPTVTGIGIPFPPDTDGDGVPDWHDLDSDNDGIHDVVENLNADRDNDGRIGEGILVVDNNGIVVTDGIGTTIIYQPILVNTDGEGEADFRDLDSDGDGLLDVAEAGVLDGNNDGILGSGVPTVDVNGVPSGVDTFGNTFSSISTPRDTDGNGTPDFQQVNVADPIDPIDPVDPVDPVTCDATNTPALAPFNGGGSYCGGSSVLLSVSGVTNGVADPVAFTWTGPNGFSQTGSLTTANSVYQITLANFSAEDVGAYTLTVTTDNGCVASASGSVSIQGTSPSVSLSGPSGAVCSGDNLQLTATNLGGGTNYEWFRDGVSLGSTSDPFFNVGAASGTYTVVATQNGCPSPTSNAYQASVSGLGASVNLSGPAGSICSGESLQLTATNLGAGTNYEWFRDGLSLGSTSDPFFNVGAAPGAYTVVATQNGCPSPVSNAYVSNVTAPPSVGIGVSGDLCNGGELQLAATDLGPGTTYSWYRDGGFVISTTDPLLTLPNATSGSYAVAATQNGCIGPLSAASPVSAGQGPNVSIDGTSGSICSGEAAMLTASDAGVGTTYEWFKDGVSLGSTSEPSFSLGAASDATSGGYTVIASKDGCAGSSSGVSTINVSSTAQIPSNLIIDNPVLCEGEDFIIRANEAIGDVTYRWFFNEQPFATTFRPQTVVQGVTLSNTGSYSVEVTQQGCNSVISSSVDVTVVPNIALSLAANRTTLCGGESFQLDVQANEPGISYDWLLDGVVIASTSDPSLTIGPVTAGNGGTYTVVPRNTQCNGAGSNPIVVNVTDAPAGGSITTANPNVCVGETVALTSTDFGAGTTYEWFKDGVSVGSTNDPSYSVGAAASSAGVYTMTPTRNGCEGSPSNGITVTVGENGEALTLSVSNPNICEGDNLTLTASGMGATYEWFRDGESLGSTNDPTLTVSAASAGNYTVVTSGGTCGGDGTSNAINVTVGENGEAPTLSVSNPNICAGDDLTLSASGMGAIYEWFRDGESLGSTNDPTLTVSAASAGSYTVVTPSSTCGGGTSNAINVTVGENGEAPTLSVSNPNICEGDDLILSATGMGATYEWFRDGESFGATNDPMLIISGASAGSYTVVTSGGTCGGDGTSNAINVTVGENGEAPTLSVSNPNICAGDDLTLSATGMGATYEWFRDGESLGSTNDPTLTVSTASAGIYTVVASGGTCGGGTSNGITVTVGENGEAPTLSVSNPDICAGDNLTLTATGMGATYEWFRDGESLGSTNDPILTVDVAIAGSYTVVTSGGTCGDGTSDPVLVVVSEVPALGAFDAASFEACEGETITLSLPSAGEGLTYNWFRDGELVGTTTASAFEVTASEATAGNYSVIASVGECQSEPSTVQVGVMASAMVPTISIANIENNSICAGESITLNAAGAEGATSFEWFKDGESIGSTAEATLSVDNATAGNYTVAVSGGCGGGTSELVSLAINEVPTASATITPIPDLDCGASSTNIDANLPTGLSGMWSSSNPNVVFADPTNPNTMVSGLGETNSVTWTLSDPLCGADIASATSAINTDIGTSTGLTSIPDVISPNNDGLNDVLRIPFADCQNLGFKIFNRWGDLVYETDRYDNNNGFNGDHDGNPLPPGPYYYLLTEPGSEKRSGCISIYR